MKKTTAVIAFFVSLLPIGQPLLIGTGAALTSTAVILAVTKKAKAESAVFYYKRGLRKRQSGDINGAISDYSKAIDIDPTFFDAFYNRGNAKSFGLRDFSSAISDYTKAIQLNPREKRIASVYGNRGISKIQLKDVKGACSDWRKALSLGERGTSQWIRDFCEST